MPPVILAITTFASLLDDKLTRAPAAESLTGSNAESFTRSRSGTATPLSAMARAQAPFNQVLGQLPRVTSGSISELTSKLGLGCASMERFIRARLICSTTGASSGEFRVSSSPQISFNASERGVTVPIQAEAPTGKSCAKLAMAPAPLRRRPAVGFSRVSTRSRAL